MREAGVENIVFSSTCAVYGVPEKVPIRETTAEGAAQSLWRHQAGDRAGAPLVRRRLWHRDLPRCATSTPPAPIPDGEIGEDHDPETHLIPLVLRAALGRGDPVEIFGTDYPTPDGTAIRDYIHVSDLADAHVRALGHLAAGGDSAALNLGTGQRPFGARGDCRGRADRRAQGAAARGGAPAGDPPELVADPALARSLLGWQSRHSDLDTIIGTALAWETRRPRGPAATMRK